MLTQSDSRRSSICEIEMKDDDHSRTNGAISPLNDQINNGCNNQAIAPTMLLSPTMLNGHQDRSPTPQSKHSAVSSAVSTYLNATTEWRSIYLCSAITFMSSVQNTLYFTTLWPFMKTLDIATETYAGIVVSSFSLSLSFASPLLGFWSNKIGRLRAPLFFCALMSFIGNMIYFLIEILPINPRYSLIVARIISGIGSSTPGLCKSYASSASLSKDRTRAIAFVTGGVALGTVMGPAFQILFTGISDNGLRIPGTTFNISMYNAPALFCCCINLICLLYIKLVFKECFVGIVNKKTKRDEVGYVKLPKIDRVGIAVCHLLRFTQLFTITNLETIGGSLEMTMFLWTASEVTFYSSLTHGFRGLLAFIIYFIYIYFPISDKINERLTCFTGILALMGFHLITYSWPFLPNNVQTYNSSTFSNISEKKNALGCDIVAYDWCDSIKALNVYVYYIFYVIMIGYAFPQINVTLNTIFSRIIGPRMQSTKQGLLEMTGGIAKTIGPLFIGILYEKKGPRLVWIAEMISIGTIIIVWILAYKRLVPLKLPPDFVCDGSPTTTDSTLCNATNGKVYPTIELPDQKINQDSQQVIVNAIDTPKNKEN